MSQHHLPRFILRIRYPYSPIPRTLPTRKPHIRFSSSTPKTTPPSPKTIISPSPSSPTPPSNLHNRLLALHNRLPRFLHPYTEPLLSAPKTYIISFLLLHEITAIVPLFTLAGAFHYTGWLPTDMVPQEKLEGGVRRFEKWFRRRGWFGYGAGGEEGPKIGEGDAEITAAKGGSGEGTDSKVDRIVPGEDEGNRRGKRIVLEVATAYAITKLLLPVRIAVCVWGTPWFARVMGRFGGLVGAVKRKSG